MTSIILMQLLRKQNHIYMHLYICENIYTFIDICFVVYMHSSRSFLYLHLTYIKCPLKTETLKERLKTWDATWADASVHAIRGILDQVRPSQYPLKLQPS